MSATGRNMGPFTPVKIARDTVFTPGCPGMDGSHSQPGSVLSRVEHG